MFLARQDSAVAALFFKRVPQFTGSLRRVHGPAAALSHSLGHVGWQFNAQGQIIVDAFQSFGFMKGKRYLQLSWQNNLVKQRASLRSRLQFPDISADETRQVLNFSWIHREGSWRLKSLGGTSSPKGPWIADEASLCPWCQREGSLPRLAFVEVRKPYRRTLEAIQGSGFSYHLCDARL